MIFPAVLVQLAFAYVPMAGMLMAFRNVDELHLPFGTKWVGFANFYFLRDPYFWLTVRNTFIIAGTKFLFIFPAPIILALMLNEIGYERFKKVVQTISYLPHFISWVVVVNILDRMLNLNAGLVNGLIAALGGKPIHFTGDVKWFLPIAVLSNLWKEVGFSSIIYLAALTQIDPQLYEAAKVDGAGKIAQILYITIPGIFPTISMMLILSIPNLINAGFDQIYLLSNPMNMPVSEILEIYILRTGLSYGDFAKASAMGICNSLVALILVTIANKTSQKLGGSTIW
ncbi:MAG: sugar ABC transporter permease [Firmicutes bacterium]|nr:sugar ABC transporter permease [Bacillota bacterium]